jgi:hypothetical protein
VPNAVTLGSPGRLRIGNAGMPLKPPSGRADAVRVARGRVHELEQDQRDDERDHAEVDVADRP